MLVGVGPLLGAGEVGAYVYPTGARTPWTYRAGTVALDGRVWGDGVADPLAPPPPVAVLTSRLTASAGEAVAVAFRGRPGTRSFGEPTAGVPSHNRVATLRDGAWLVVTVAQDADRTGRVYGSQEQLFPDRYVTNDWTHAGPADLADDAVLHAALAWLR